MRLIKIEGGRINVHEPQILTTNVAVTSGQALKLVGGKLQGCGATDKPVFIALANAGANSDVPVGRVEPNQIYEVASPGNVAVGTKYTLADGAQGITATSTSGVAEVVYADSRVAHVRFS